MSANSTKSTQQFNEQLYLLMELVKGAILPSEFAQKQATNVPLNIMTDGSYDPAAIVNFALNAKEQDKILFSRMTTDQLSALVPHIKLYKAIGDVYKPFYFPNSTTLDEVEDITKSGGRLRGAGIQNFSVNFHGANTFTADKMLRCNLSVFVQNMNSLFDEPPGSGDYAKLAELITISTKKNGKDSSKLVKSGDGRVDSSQTTDKMANFEIAAEVGWSVYPEMKELFSRSQIRAVEANRMSIRMTLTNHSLNFEQNGTLVINAEYVGRLETVFEQRTSDMLLDMNMFGDINKQMKTTRTEEQDMSIGDTSDPRKKNEVCTKPQQLLSSQLTDILSRLDTSFESSKIYSIELSKEDEERFFKEALEGPSPASDKQSGFSETSGGAEEQAGIDTEAAGATNAEETDEIRAASDAQLDEIISYDTLLQRFQDLDSKCQNNRNLLNSGTPSDPNNPNKPAGMADYCGQFEEVSRQLDTTATPSGWSSQAAERAAEEKKRRSNKDSLAATDPASSSGDKKDAGSGSCSDPDENENTSSSSKATDSKENKKATKKNKPGPKRTPATESEKAQAPRINLAKRNIHFFYLADLFEVLLQKLKENYAATDDEQIKRQMDTFRIILGTIKLTAGDLTRTISLGDIPITVREYSYWFMDKVVRKRRTRYGFKNFMKDLMSHLVFKAIKGFSFRDAPVLDNNIKFGSTVMTSQDQGERLKNKTVVSIGDLPSFSSKTTKGGIYEEVDYIIFYTREEEKVSRPKRTGNPEVDEKNGIPHLYLGLNRGLVKDIKFDQVTMKFRRESLIANAVDLFDELRMPYNANITMFGNTLFLPGTQFYINPLTIGMGDPRNPNSAAVRLGLGGYYMVTNVTTDFNGTTLTTSLTGIYEGWPENRPDDKSNPTTADVDPIKNALGALGDKVAGSLELERSPDEENKKVAELASQVFSEMQEPTPPATALAPPPLNSASNLRQNEMVTAELIAKRIDTHVMSSPDFVLPPAVESDIRSYANSLMGTPEDNVFYFVTRNYGSDNESAVMFEMMSGDTYIFTFSGSGSERIMTPRSEIPWTQEDNVVLGGK